MASPSSSGSEDVSPESTPPRKSPHISIPPPVLVTQTVSHHDKAFVPDVMLIGAGVRVANCHELLIVEVKSGVLLLESDYAQLKFMLIPFAIKQGKALGLLICSMEATIIKAWVQDGEMIFASKTFTFSGRNLVTQLADVMIELNAHIHEYAAKNKKILKRLVNSHLGVL